MRLAHRVGIGWREELAAGIVASLDKIDVLEVIAEEWLKGPDSRVRALRTLGRQRPVLLHGTGMGMAATAGVERERLERMARLMEKSGAESWSEHFAFVRAGGVEIGHLAAPPRNTSTVEATAENLELARRVTGRMAMMENISTLIDPPGSSMEEACWIAGVQRESGAELLLDLHNVHANAVNFGYDAAEFLGKLDWDLISTVHIAGGRMLPEGRVLDDHLHDVPVPVYELLREAGRRAVKPLTVILERDGNYPRMEELLEQIEQARRALT